MLKSWTLFSLVVLAPLVQTRATAQTLREEIDQQLARAIIASDTPLQEVQAFTSSRVPDVPDFQDIETWEQTAASWREDTLNNIIFRGDIAKSWRDAETEVQWSETIDDGVGYQIRKFIYEALPGMWIPALLYEPDDLAGQVPVVLNVNGHDKLGKATDFKQIRCINLAKRGMLAVSTEWLGFGQLETDGFHHDATTQVDLCGQSGLAPYYLSLSRALDILLDHPNADPERVAVTGLSGGGWQTIMISALDTRVTVANPVAGYSSLRTRAFELRDLGDPEQAPNDMATIVDYTHLTAMMAPRPTLLTFNTEDRCCFAPATTLPALLAAAEPIYALYGQEDQLRQHIHLNPRTHNYDQDNREAHYRFLGDFFFPGDATYIREEIDSTAELKSVAELTVPLPEDNLDFSQLAALIAAQLPREEFLPPTDEQELEEWETTARARLTELTHYFNYTVTAEQTGTHSGAVEARLWKLSMNNDWTVPVVEFVPAGEALAGTTIVISDDGRTTVGATVENLLESNHRVLAIDPFFFGESHISTPSVVRKDWLLALLVSAVGERPIGIQASQIAAAARWASSAFDSDSIDVQAYGKGSSLFSLIAACIEPRIGDTLFHDSLASLKEILTNNETASTAPEQFTFGLLEHFDIEQLAQLALSTPNVLRSPMIDWPTPESIPFGAALASQQLNATANAPGEFVYTPDEGTVLSVGEHTLTAEFVPDDSNEFASATAEVTISVNPRMPLITWDTPQPIEYGTLLGAGQLNATADVPGSLMYDPEFDTALEAGDHLLTVTFTPDDSVNFTEATKEVTLVVQASTPVITWAPPVAIAFGTPLSSTQLNATANVPGDFTYTPQLGTTLDAGAQTLAVSFSPTDSQNFAPATKEVALTVNQRVPSLTWDTPEPIIFGTKLSPQQLNASSEIPGLLAYTPPLNSLLPAGSHSLSANFAPTDEINFAKTQIEVTLIVNARTPVVDWPSPLPIIFGTPLDNTQLNATADVAGSFSYDPPEETILPTGEREISVTFTATDSANFETVTLKVPITVQRRLPEVTWETPLEITFGTPIGLTEIPFAVDLPGSFTFDPTEGTVLNVGTHTLTVTFNPDDTLNYRSATVRASVSVVKRLGDLTGDGDLDARDVDDFIEAIISPTDYQHRTGRDPLLGDMNGDGELNSSDIDDFVATMTELGSLTESQLKRLNQLPALKSPAQDDDGDGSRNSEELAAGTNPYDATDQFRITLTTSANGALTIQWSSVPGKSYTIESSETLTGRWAALPDATIRATASSASHSFPVPATTRYYRVSLLRL